MPRHQRTRAERHAPVCSSTPADAWLATPPSTQHQGILQLTVALWRRSPPPPVRDRRPSPGRGAARRAGEPAAATVRVQCAARGHAGGDSSHTATHAVCGVSRCIMVAQTHPCSVRATHAGACAAPRAPPCGAAAAPRRATRRWCSSAARARRPTAQTACRCVQQPPCLRASNRVGAVLSPSTATSPSTLPRTTCRGRRGSRSARCCSTSLQACWPPAPPSPCPWPPGPPPAPARRSWRWRVAAACATAGRRAAASAAARPPPASACSPAPAPSRWARAAPRPPWGTTLAAWPWRACGR